MSSILNRQRGSRNALFWRRVMLFAGLVLFAIAMIFSAWASLDSKLGFPAVWVRVLFGCVVLPLFAYLLTVQGGRAIRHRRWYGFSLLISGYCFFTIGVLMLLAGPSLHPGCFSSNPYLACEDNYYYFWRVLFGAPDCIMGIVLMIGAVREELPGWVWKVSLVVILGVPGIIGIWGSPII